MGTDLFFDPPWVWPFVLGVQCSHSIGQFHGIFEPGQPLCRRAQVCQLKKTAFIFLKGRLLIRGRLMFMSGFTHLLAAS